MCEFGANLDIQDDVTYNLYNYYSETLEFNAYQIENESNRTEPNRIESNRIEPNRTGSNRIESNRKLGRISTERISNI
jgi:hypothetical protein